MAVTVFASFSPKPGQEAAVEKILRGMTGPTRGEPGNRTYDLYGAGRATAIKMCEDLKIDFDKLTRR